MKQAEKSVPAGRRPHPRATRREQGAALLLFMILVVMAALAYLVSSLGPELTVARRERQTQDALVQAREALIGYALQYRDDQIKTGTYDAMYGYLPMPDVGTSRFSALQPASCNTEGCAISMMNGAFPAENETIVGRLPWRTLGIEPIRDGHGECLWYIVSANHKNLGISATVRMNPDTLGQIDIVTPNETDKLKSLIASAQDRPIAIIFSPGPPVGIQNRGPIGGDDVTKCGGNYDPQHYLDPNLATALLDHAGAPTSASAYFSGVRATNTSTTNLAISTQGRVFADGTNLKAACPTGSTNCALVGNDSGLALTSDTLFGAIRKHAYFRTDINSLLDRITGCLRDQGVPSNYDKIVGADTNSCYGKDIPPRGYYPHYKEMIFVAGNATTKQVNGVNCAGALLFGNQRDIRWESAGESSGNIPKCPKDNPANPYQCRVTGGDKSNPANYLEGINRTSFTASGTAFFGQEIFERVSANQTVHQDIVRCIPASPSFTPVTSPTLGGTPLVAYDTATRTLTLGRQVDTALSSSLTNFLFGCAWQPETHAMGGGLRSYFTFRIDDPGLYDTWPQMGFTFAIVDGDNNGTGACGAAGQHLGYSGNNTESPFIAQPKIAFEVDPRREGAVFPSSSTSHLTNGRNDPPTDSANYRGGHVALVYWGGETPISAPAISPCDPPAYLSGGACTLPQEEDDNVHGQATPARTGFPVPPPNPAAPIPRLTVPPDTPAGVYKLDPDTTSAPANQTFHVRVELTRTASPYNLPRVRVATTGEINLSAPGTIDTNGIHLFQVDGVYLFPGDRVLVKNQSDATQNGIYVWEGADKVMKRADDASSVEALAGVIVEVMQGVAHGGQLWRQLTAQSVTCVNPLENPVNCTPFYWQPARLAQYGDLPSASTQPGRIVYVQKGDQANGWFRSDGSSWQRIWADLSTQQAINLNNPDTIDGVVPAAGSRILVRHQSNTAENGVYVWNGAGIAMGRASDFDSGPELAGVLVQVLSGTDAGRAFRQTAMPYGGTVGTSAITWEAIDASPRYLLEAWLLRDSPSYTQLISAMQDTTRPMSFLTAAMNPPPDFPPQLRDTPVIPYPFRKARLGFTIGQRTSINDQTVTVGNFFTTWLD